MAKAQWDHLHHLIKHRFSHIICSLSLLSFNHLFFQPCLPFNHISLHLLHGFLHNQSKSKAARIDERVQRRKSDRVNNEDSFIFLKIILSLVVALIGSHGLVLSSEFVGFFFKIFLVFFVHAFYLWLSILERWRRRSLRAISFCVRMRWRRVTGTKNGAAITKGRVAVE